MPGIARALALTSAVFLLTAPPAFAQKSGGVLKFFHRDSPASMSIHEEATISTVAPMMGVFNNLVLFKQNEKPSGRCDDRKQSRFPVARIHAPSF